LQGKGGGETGDKGEKRTKKRPPQKEKEIRCSLTNDLVNQKVRKRGGTC